MVERREFMGGKTDGFMLATARTRDIAYSQQIAGVLSNAETPPKVAARFY
jgi:hypothetical protein